jgi:hypothetical protein
VNKFYNNNDGLSILTGIEIDTSYLKDLNRDFGIFEKLTEVRIKSPITRKEIIVYTSLADNYSQSKEK